MSTNMRYRMPEKPPRYQTLLKWTARMCPGDVVGKDRKIYKAGKDAAQYLNAQDDELRRKIAEEDKRMAEADKKREKVEKKMKKRRKLEKKSRRKAAAPTEVEIDDCHARVIATTPTTMTTTTAATEGSIRQSPVTV